MNKLISTLVQELMYAESHDAHHKKMAMTSRKIFCGALKLG